MEFVVHVLLCITCKSFVHFFLAVGSVEPGSQQAVAFLDLARQDQKVQHVSICWKRQRSYWWTWIEKKKKPKTKTLNPGWIGKWDKCVLISIKQLHCWFQILNWHLISERGLHMAENKNTSILRMKVCYGNLIDNNTGGFSKIIKCTC